jgi:glycerophosphoryl diester phosphodiesterase
MTIKGWGGTAARGLALAGLVAGAALSFGATSASASHHAGEVIAHRGGYDAAPESTLAAIGHSIRAGADGVEFDIRFTKDDVPVLMHDDTVDRTTNCHGYVYQLTYRQLENCDAGTWFSSSFRGERVPSFNTAMSYIAGHSRSLQVFVHVKDNSSGEARELVSTISRNHMDNDRTTIIGSDEGVLRTMRAAGAGRVGYVFSNPAGWDSNWPVLIPYNVDVTRGLVARAERRGAEVFGVQDHPCSLSKLSGLGLTGLLANDLGDALRMMNGHGYASHPAHHAAHASAHRASGHSHSHAGNGGGTGSSGGGGGGGGGF